MFAMKTIIITNDPGIAADAQTAGVARIMVDLENHGKEERQKSRTTFISTHKPADIAAIRAVLKTTQLIVRINPWHKSSGDEIDHAVGQGADLVMLPMITSMAHLDAFLDYLNGRAQPMPLVETGYSMAHISDIVSRESISEVYIGLNDLHLSLGLDFLFEPLGLGLVEWMAMQIKGQDKSFGFGGIASNAVILSSRFCKDVKITEPVGRLERLQSALTAMQAEYHALSKRSPGQQYEDSKRTAALIKTLADKARIRSTF
jgi:hypothetical protein